jgi:ribosomal protein S5
MAREQAPLVKKGDDSRELALARAQSWLLQQAVEAFQASTGLELQLRPAPPGLGLQAGGWLLRAA